MDPLDPASFDQKDVKIANGRTYHVCDQLPEGYEHGKTPVLLLCHGYPELWYEWRHQIGPWVKRGWRVIAPDQLGYGGTDKPDDASLYSPYSTAGDMEELLTALDIHHPIVIIGHDWGSSTTWAFGLRFPDRVKALVSISIPFYLTGLPMALDIPMLVSTNPDLLGYWLYWPTPEGAKEIQANLPRYFDHLYRSIKTMVDWTPPGASKKIMDGEIQFDGESDIMSAKEKRFYLDTFEKGGIDAPLNFYRSLPHWYEQEQALKLKHSYPETLPILLLAPTGEKFAAESRIEPTRAVVPSLEVIPIESNHWVMVERGPEVAQIIGDWVERKLK